MSGQADDNSFVSSIVKNFIGGICAFDVDSKTRSITPVYINEGFYRMMNATQAQTDALLKNLRLSVIPDDLPLLEQGIDDILADNGSAECEFRIVSPDGNVMWLRLRGNLLLRDGSRNTLNCVILDCTEQKMIEEELKRQSDYMHLLMDTDITFDFNCRTDVCVYRICETNALEHDAVIKGYLEQIPSSGIYEEDEHDFEEMIKSAMLHAHRDSLEFRSKGIINPTEEFRWFKVDIVSILGKEGYVSHVIGHITDIHEEKLKQLELKLRADRDSLTGLMNKGATEEMIHKILPQYADSEMIGALMMLDTDDFKHINDTYGHATGDRVLEKIGEILRNNFKGMDVTGRVGGDEFMVFMHNIHSGEDAGLLAAKIERLVMHAFDGEPLGKDVSMSIGISLCPGHATTYEELYAKADKALYFVKEHGKADYRIYSEELEAQKTAGL